MTDREKLVRMELELVKQRTDEMQGANQVMEILQRARSSSPEQKVKSGKRISAEEFLDRHRRPPSSMPSGQMQRSNSVRDVLRGSGVLPESRKQ